MTSALLLGCIGDDFTGSTDLANTLVRNGMRTVQLLGVPGDDANVPDADAIVEHLTPEMREGDVVAIMSNGGFGGIHDKILNVLKD